MLGDDFYYRKLSTPAAAIYMHFLSEFRAKHFADEYYYQTRLFQSTHILTAAESAIKALSRDHPELFFFSSEYTVARHGCYLKFRGLTAYSNAQILRLEKLLERELSLLTEDVMEYDEWERERIIYERVASRYQYNRHGERLDYSVAGLLLREEGVCSAYANMLILALRKAGIACRRISGGGHAWTIVYIHDIPVHCDVTWESHTGPNSIAYSYFNLTNEEIARDHVLQDNDLPRCSFRGYNYHRKTNCCFASADAAKRFLRSSLRRGDKVIRLKTEPGAMIRRSVEKELQRMLFREYQYSINEKQGTAIILRE